MKLTKEQAIVVMGYTNHTTLDFSLFHEDVEKRLGRPVWTHEFANQDFSNLVQNLYKEDFISMCYSEEVK